MAENMDHPNLSDEINKAKASQNEDTGVFIDKLPVGTIVKIETKRSIYIFEVQDATGRVHIKGTGNYFNEITPARIIGSNFGGTMLKSRWVGIGMRMEVLPDGPLKGVITSAIRRITVIREGRNVVST